MPVLRTLIMKIPKVFNVVFLHREGENYFIHICVYIYIYIYIYNITYLCLNAQKEKQQCLIKNKLVLAKTQATALLRTPPYTKRALFNSKKLKFSRHPRPFCICHFLV